MAKHLGDYDISTIIYGKFSTFRPSTGATYTLGGTPALSVYKDGSDTQSTAGITLTADFDSVTGLNHFAIDTSADGTFYAAGSNFDVVITTGTIDSVSVTGSVVASFTLRKGSALKPTTAGRTLDVSAGGEAGLDWANVGSPTATVGLSGTTVKTATDVEADTQDIQSRLPTALSGGYMKCDVFSMQAGTIAAAAFAANAITSDALDNTAGEFIAAYVWNQDITGYITANGGSDILRGISTAVNALNDLSSSEVATAVWNAGTASYGTAGSYGLLLETNIDAAISSRLATLGYTAPPTAAQNATAVLTTAMTESYAADGAAPTLAQAIFLCQQRLTEFSISGTAITVKKLDGSTAAATLTMNDASTPTSSTRTA